VIERTDFDFLPAFRGMALCAIRAEVTTVGIPMAWSAIGKLQAAVANEHGSRFITDFRGCRPFLVTFSAG